MFPLHSDDILSPVLGLLFYHVNHLFVKYLFHCMHVRRRLTLRKSVIISSLFIKISNSHNIANKLTVGSEAITVLNKRRNYYTSSVFFPSALFQKLLMLRLYINSNCFFIRNKSNSKYISKDTSIPLEPHPTFQINNVQSNLFNVFKSSYFFKPYNIFLKNCTLIFLQVLSFQFNLQY